MKQSINDDLCWQMSSAQGPEHSSILAMYHRAFFAQHHNGQFSEIRACMMHEPRYVRGNRLYVSLEYRDRYGEERVAWQLYLPVGSFEQAARHALKCLLTGSASGKTWEPASGSPRTPLLFEQQA